MATDNRVGLLISMPFAVKQAIVREAERQDSGVNDVLIQILASHCRVEFKLTGRKATKPRVRAGDVLVRMSPQLRRRIQRDSARHEANSTDTILRTLCATLNVSLDIPPPKQKPVTPIFPEQSGRAFSHRAAAMKSCVILAGSILENNWPPL